MDGLTAGFAICGSFCTIKESISQITVLKNMGLKIIPILSDAVYSTDNRFNNAKDLKEKIEELTENKIIHTITEAEPIGPKRLLDILIISPCTGNTLAKLAGGITDTSVTMAAKAHLRNNRPIVIALATNDALGASAINIGKLLNTKNIYFVPFGQDDPHGKNNSLISDFKQIPETVKSALNGKQIQPILLK